MKKIKFELSAKEYLALEQLADDGKHVPQTPDELAHDVVVMWLVTQQERP